MRVVLLAMLLLPMVARAGVQLQVEGVEGPLQQAVVAGVQLSQYGQRDVTEAQVRRLFADAEQQASQALQPYGYFDAEVTGSLTRQGEDWVAVLKVDLGQPVRVDVLDIKLPDAARDLPEVHMAVTGFHPRPGEILDQGAYSGSKGAIKAALASVGYLDASMPAHRIEVYPDQHRADIQLHWDVGTRYRLGEVSFEGSQLKPGFLQRYVPFEPGDWYSQTKLLALQQALTGADYFSVINVLPQVDEASDGRIDVKVKLDPAKRSVYTGGPFIGSDVGLGIRVGVKRRWVNDSGHTWRSQLVLAQRLKSLSSWYTIPMPGPHHRSFNFGGKYRDIDTESTHARTLELVAKEVREWHGWLRTLGVNVLAGTFTVGRRGDEPRDTPGVVHGRSTMVFAEASLLKRHADHPGFVLHGWKLRLAARSTAGSLLSATHFTQVVADAKWIHAFNPRNRLILRGTAGTSWVGDFNQLPPQLRFFAGGASSIRGYGFKALGPRNEYDRVMGGRNLLIASATVEHYFTPKWGIAAFVDAGNAFNDVDFEPQMGAGLGLRWNSPVGMVRLDLGVPINTSRYHGVHLHLVIGPDL